MCTSVAELKHAIALTKPLSDDGQGIGCVYWTRNGELAGRHLAARSRTKSLATYLNSSVYACSISGRQVGVRSVTKPSYV